MQEQVDREAIAISLKASRITASTLRQAFELVLGKVRELHQNRQAPHGRQSIKQLMNHNVPVNTIPIEGDDGLFDRVARKWNVDYAFHQTGENKYLLLFKSGQADAVTAAFSEYSALVLKQAKEKKTPIAEQAKKAEKEAERARKPKHHERKREREVVRE